MTRVYRVLFISIFALMLMVPLLTVNLSDGVVSETENRTLAPKAHVFLEDGSVNRAFPAEFEAWINDNIGLRAHFVAGNARMQYYGFGVLANNSDMYPGPGGELNYATKRMLKDYQHLNLPTEDELRSFAASMQELNDYVENDADVFLYYQCWDKHSIYPEQFPKSVIQYGEASKTDMMMDALRSHTTVCVISPKQELIAAKPVYDTYSAYCDPTHWSNRGAYIGYVSLMEGINRETNGQYRILTEDDYEITMEDQGYRLFGGIHLQEYREVFRIKHPQAVLTNEKLTLYGEHPDSLFYTNPSADNHTRILLIGDSYFNFYIIDDIAESFYETVVIHADHLRDMQNVIDTYDTYGADIVIIESAERGNRMADIIEGVNAMRDEE